MMKNMSKRIPALALCLALALLAGGGLAEGYRVALPDGNHSVRIPGDMTSQSPAQNETDLRGIYLLEPDLEMLVYSYDAGNSDVYTLAEALSSQNREAEVRRISDTDFLVFQDRDEADGAACVGYGYISGGKMVEISFFYSTQDAMDLTRAIMESFE